MEEVLQGFETGEIDGADCKKLYCVDCLPSEFKKSATIMEPDSLGMCCICASPLVPWP